MSTTERFLFNICGTSKVQPWPIGKPGEVPPHMSPAKSYADGKGSMPFIGDVVSEYVTCTQYEALVRRAQLARLHRSSDFTAQRIHR